MEEKNILTKDVEYALLTTKVDIPDIFANIAMYYCINSTASNDTIL